MASDPRIRRATEAETSFWPRWTPSAPDAKATSGRSLTMNRAPWRPAAARNASLHRRRSPPSACFSRSCTTSAPADRTASRNAGRSGRAPVTTYSRARASRSRLSTGHRSNQLEAVPVGQLDRPVPRALERLAVALDHDELRIESSRVDEVLDGRAGIDLVALAVRDDLHPSGRGGDGRRRLL